MARKPLWMDTNQHSPSAFITLRAELIKRTPSFCSLIYLKLKPEDIIKAEQQVSPCLKWAICILKYVWILGDDFSKGYKLFPGKTTFGICFTVCFTRIACLLAQRFVKWMYPAEISGEAGPSILCSYVPALGNLSVQMHQTYVNS